MFVYIDLFFFTFDRNLRFFFVDEISTLMEIKLVVVS